jgi:hypothetical protein
MVKVSITETIDLSSIITVCEKSLSCVLAAPVNANDFQLVFLFSPPALEALTSKKHRGIEHHTTDFGLTLVQK